MQNPICMQLPYSHVSLLKHSSAADLSASSDSKHPRGSLTVSLTFISFIVFAIGGLMYNFFKNPEAYFHFSQRMLKTRAILALGIQLLNRADGIKNLSLGSDGGVFFH